MTRMQDFTSGTLPAHIVRMAMPMMLGMIFQTLYVLVDLYFVSRLGKTSVAGVSAAGNVQFMVMAFTQVLNVGTMSPIAQAVGRKELDTANRLFHQAMGLSGLGLVATLVVGYASASAYGHGFAADADTATAATTYLLAYIPGLALQFPMVVMGAAFRAIGVNAPILAVQMGTVICNAVLAPVLIAGLGTGRPLGVAGAGLASSIAIALGVMVMAFFFRRMKTAFTWRMPLLKPVVADWRRVLSVGLPSGGEMALMFVYSALIYAIIKDFGSAAQAGFGIGSRVMQSLFIPAMAIAFATAPVAGQNIGAGRLDRAKDAFRAGVSLETLCMVALTVLAQWQGSTMVRVFSSDPAVTSVATEFLGLISWNFAAQGVIFTVGGMFQAIGNTLPSLLASSSRLVLFAAPALWMSRQPGFTLRQLWLLSIATVTLQAGLAVWMLLREFRKRQ